VPDGSGAEEIPGVVGWQIRPQSFESNFGLTLATAMALFAGFIHVAVSPCFSVFP
jgi:hypothetical protein